jgi:phosphomevalonate kinase
MRKITMSAPGKAVLCGEYAVLDGAPAIVMAVNRRARVVLQSTNEPSHSLAVSDREASPFRFRFGESAEILPVGGNLPSLDPGLISHVWRAVGSPEAGSIAMQLDTGAFYDVDSGEKLGLGSSAALAVALTSAFLRFIGDRREPGPIALSAHRAFQGGCGSGVDIAAALHGGLMAFDTTTNLATQALQWPTDMVYSLWWSGRAASTADKLRNLEENKGTATARASADRLRRGSERVLEAWRSGNSKNVLGTLQDYCGALQQFSIDLNLGIFDAGHWQLHKLAARHGLTYKPCGAGAGDIGIVLGIRQGALEDFAGHAAGFGFKKLPVMLDACGLNES